ncbi:MAG: 8-amino-7-oxononanoate synthase, partial [Mycobacterium sp.]
MEARTDTSPLAWLDEVEADRRRAGLRRSLRTRSPVGAEIDLASNDYLGLSQHPAVIDGGVEALRTWGAGSTGSRLVTGNTELHEEFEGALAEFVGATSALVFSSGYTANLAAVVALSGAGSLVVSDARSHASLVDACRLSRARVVVTPHRDVDAVDAALAARHEHRAVVVTDSVFSADGALAPLMPLHEVCRRHGALLIVDEAHGLGVRGDGGRGLLHEVGLAGVPDVVMTTTLSKALGSQGGVVLGPAAVREHLVDAARPMI